MDWAVPGPAEQPPSRSLNQAATASVGALLDGGLPGQGPDGDSPGPAQQQHDPARKLVWAERFDEVVIGAEPKPRRLVSILGRARHKDHGDVGSAPQRGEHVEAALCAQGQVEEDQLRVVPPEGVEGGSAV
jgi:hypothetical protein